MRKTVLGILLSASCLLGLPAWAAPHIHVMILDGESAAPYHNWPVVTQVLKKELDEVGLFDVDVVTAPPAGGDFSNFKPEWGRYQVIVFNYDAPQDRWSADLKASFEKYMRDGGGLVTVHASDNAFNGWEAYNEMIGVGGWRGRDEKSGPHWYYKDGQLTSDDKPGHAGHHGLRIPFKMTVRAPEHPITKGLPNVWMHQGDELYANLRGPGKNMTVLATGYSDPANSGTGYDEPLLMVLRYGKGRVFHSAIGHDASALSSVDAVVTLQRGVEWAATGKVTQKVPKSYPTSDTVSYRTDIAAIDPNYSKGMNPLDLPVKQGSHDVRSPNRAPGSVPPQDGPGR